VVNGDTLSEGYRVQVTSKDESIATDSRPETPGLYRHCRIATPFIDGARYRLAAGSPTRLNHRPRQCRVRAKGKTRASARAVRTVINNGTDREKTCYHCGRRKRAKEFREEDCTAAWIHLDHALLLCVYGQHGHERGCGETELVARWQFWRLMSNNLV